MYIIVCFCSAEISMKFYKFWTWLATFMNCASLDHAATQMHILPRQSVTVEFKVSGFTATLLSLLLQTEIAFVTFCLLPR